MNLLQEEKEDELLVTVLLVLVFDKNNPSNHNQHVEEPIVEVTIRPFNPMAMDHHPTHRFDFQKRTELL